MKLFALLLTLSTFGCSEPEEQLPRCNEDFSCDSSTHICVLDGTPEHAHCYQRCSHEEPECDDGFQCTRLYPVRYGAACYPVQTDAGVP